MTNDEFQRWFAHHRTCYPRIDAWLGRLKGEYDSKAVLRNWYKALQDVDLEDAMTATDAMFRGDFAEPREWDQHPSTIRKSAKGFAANRRTTTFESKPRFINGEPVYHCRDCLDQGLLTVWHPQSIKAMRDGTFGGTFTEYTCAVRCTCDAANKYRWIPHVFDDRKMVPSAYRPSDEDRQALADFVNAVPAVQAWNPADFNQDEGF